MIPATTSTSIADHAPARDPEAGGWRDWILEGSIAAAVLVIGLLEADGDRQRVVVLLLAVAVLLFRKRPSVALGLVWLIAGLHAVVQVPVVSAEFAVAVVAFGCARWGRVATVVISGISIPAVAAGATLLVLSSRYGLFTGSSLYREIIDTAYRFSDTLLVGAVVLGMLVLAVPWIAGLAVRATVRARRSEVSQVAAEEQAARAELAATQAQEIARLRDDQARLARDVHDVVGHSLAVILAQAESAQYLPDDDPARLKQTMSTIATSARTSLQDVRQVLSAAVQDGHDGQDEAGPPPRAMDTLVDGVRASGHEVVSRELGTPQPMPPDTEVVAYRVLQEMLTNAIKHGRRDEPVFVERLWPDGSLAGELRIEVRNAVMEPGSTTTGDETQPLRQVVTTDAVPDGSGQGLVGMRRRLEAVGGRLDVRRREGERPGDAATFTTTAWVPVRTVSR